MYLAIHLWYVNFVTSKKYVCNHELQCINYIRCAFSEYLSVVYRMSEN